MNARRQTAIVALVVLGMAAAAGAVTTNNVTWSGGGGAGNPYWDVDANWVGGVAPTNPTPGSVTLGTNVTGKLDADRTVRRLTPATGTWVGYAHALDLNGHTLTVEGDVGVNQCCAGFILTLTNGTLRVGSDTRAGSLLMVGNYSTHQLTLARGMRLQTATNTVIRGQATINADTSFLDLRGVEMADGALDAQQIVLWGSGAAGAPIKMDANTQIESIQVVSNLSLANGSYIGDPATLALPANLDVQVGLDGNRRGLMSVGGGDRTTKLLAGADNSFAACLTALCIPNSDSGASAGILDLTATTNCTIDTLGLWVGCDRASPGALDAQDGTVRLPPAALMTAGNAVIGGKTKGRAVIDLDRAAFVVTNSIALHPTAWITNRLGSTPSGLDIRGSIEDEGGHIHVAFGSAPAVATNWGIRVQGDAVSTLGGMAGCGRLTSTGTYAGWKSGVVYDAGSNCTYFALVDESVELPVIASARDEMTFEIAPGGQVQIAGAEIDVGSYDPEGRTPVAITISSNGTAFASNLTFEAAGEYVVTLKIEVGDPVEASSTDACVIHVVPVHGGVVSSLTWCGQAPSALMDRREWMWSANWVEGVPPTNPTPGTICFKTWGQNVVGKLDGDRTVGGLCTSAGTHVSPHPAHLLDLNGHTLTVAGDVGYNSCCYNFTFAMSNGTLRLGSAGTPGRVLFGGTHQPQFVTLAPGMKIETVNVSGILSDSGDFRTDGLDMRGVEWVGGFLRVGEVRLTAAGGCSRLLLDSCASGGTFHVRQRLRLGSGTGCCYVGDVTEGKLPEDVNLVFGDGVLAPAEVVIYPGSKLVARRGGSLSGWLSNLLVGDGTDVATGRMELDAMDGCNLDAAVIRVATTSGGSGVLRLPPGTVRAGTVGVGAAGGAGAGALALSNTWFAVTNAVTLGRTAQVTVNVGTTSSGLAISNALATALNMDAATNNALVIRFLAPPSAQGLHVGFRWLGDHVGMLQAGVSAGAIVIDDAGLGSKRASVFKHAGSTYVGINTAGTVFMVR